jgi:hypothetical protein
MFTLTCNHCGNEQELKEIIDHHKIIIDIANENFNDPNFDYILIICQGCNNTYEY